VSSTSAIRAAVYTRISSDRDDTQLGVERQEKDCRDLCKRRGWTVAGVYTDNDISAADKRKVRPAYQRLLADIRSGKLDAVVVWDEDRLHRRLVELLGFVEACEAAGLTTLASVGGDTNLSDDNALFILKMKGLVAESEIAKMRKRARGQRRQKAERGEFHGGTRAFGYEPDGMTIRESEAAEIRRGAQYLLDGGNVNALRRLWMEKGLETVNGTRTADGSAPNWSRATVHQIMTSPRIAGLRQHKGAVLGEAQWPAIIDRDTWEAVRAVVKGSRPRGYRTELPNPLRGILTCSECGQLLSRTSRANRATGGRNHYYSCRTDVGGCGKVSILAKNLDGYILSILVSLAESDVTKNLIKAEHEADEAELRALLTEKAAEEDKLRKLDDLYLASQVDEDAPQVDPQAFTRQRKAIKQRLDAKEQRIAALRGTSAIENIGSGLAASWDSLTADQHRAVFGAMVSEIKIHPRNRQGANAFDPRRVRFVWRSGALARAVGFNENGELDVERLMDVWNSGALPKAIGMAPPLEWKRAVRDEAEIRNDEDADVDVIDVESLGKGLGAILPT
jgi:DNA invertase Pin-like site-specific DNA recombinase